MNERMKKNERFDSRFSFLLFFININVIYRIGKNRHGEKERKDRFIIYNILKD